MQGACGHGAQSAGLFRRFVSWPIDRLCQPRLAQALGDQGTVGVALELSREAIGPEERPDSFEVGCGTVGLVLSTELAVGGGEAGMDVCIVRNQPASGLRCAAVSKDSRAPAGRPMNTSTVPRSS